LDALITLGEFQKAGDLLKRVYIILKTYELKDWQIEVIRQLIVEAGEEQRVEGIGRVLEKEEGIRLEDLSGYLVLLQRNSIKPLIKLLGELKNSKTRRVLCDALSEIGKNAIELFTPFIDDRRFLGFSIINYVLSPLLVPERRMFRKIDESQGTINVLTKVFFLIQFLGCPFFSALQFEQNQLTILELFETIDIPDCPEVPDEPDCPEVPLEPVEPEVPELPVEPEVPGGRYVNNCLQIPGFTDFDFPDC
jgi:hypothetical protein